MDLLDSPAFRRHDLSQTATTLGSRLPCPDSQTRSQSHGSDRPGRPPFAPARTGTASTDLLGFPCVLPPRPRADARSRTPAAVEPDRSVEVTAFRPGSAPT